MLIDLSLSVHKLEHLRHPLYYPVRSILQKPILDIALGATLQILLRHLSCRPQDHRVACVETVAVVHEVIEDLIVAQL